MNVYESLVGAFGKERPDVTHRGEAERHFIEGYRVSGDYNTAIGCNNEWEGYAIDRRTYQPDPPKYHTCPWCDSALSLDALKCSQCGGPQG